MRRDDHVPRQRPAIKGILSSPEDAERLAAEGSIKVLRDDEMSRGIELPGVRMARR